MFVVRLWYRRADGALASMDSKEERVVLLDSWLAMEEALGDLGNPQDVRVTPTLTSHQSVLTKDSREQFDVETRCYHHIHTAGASTTYISHV